MEIYIDEEKNYKKLLQDYFIHRRSKDWLNGYTSCLYANGIIDDYMRFELDNFITELKDINKEEK